MSGYLSPRVSIIMPVYTDLRFFDAAVESIIAQSYRDFELITVDDGTGLGDVFAHQARRDPRIRVVTNRVNQGPMAAANLGIREARGDIIAHLDADDIAKPSLITHLVAALDADPELGLVGTNFVNIDEAGVQGAINRMPETDSDIRWTILFRNPFCHSTVAFRRTCYDAAGGYDEAEAWIASEDHEFWFRLLAQCRAQNIQDVLVEYRINPRGLSVTHSTNWRQRTDPLRKQCWARLGVPYDAAMAYELSGFVLGYSIADIALRAPAYRVYMRLLRRFLSAPRPFARASDYLVARRLLRATIERMLADETVDLGAAVDAEDWTWSRSFVAA